MPLNIPSWKPPIPNLIKGSKEAVCVWLTSKADAFERGLNGLDAIKGKDAEGVVGQSDLTLDQTNQLTNIPNWKPPNPNPIKGSKEAVCDWLTFKANAFERGLNGLDAVKGKDAEGVVGQVKRFDGRHGM